MSGFAIPLVFILAGAALAYYWTKKSGAGADTKKATSKWMRQKQARKNDGSLPTLDASRFGRPKGTARAGFGRR